MKGRYDWTSGEATPGSPPQKQEQSTARLGRPLTAEERAEHLAAAAASKERERQHKAAEAELERLKMERQLDRQRSGFFTNRGASSSRRGTPPASSRREKPTGGSTPPSTGRGTKSARVVSEGTLRKKQEKVKHLVKGEGTNFIRTDGRHVQDGKTAGHDASEWQQEANDRYYEREEITKLKKEAQERLDIKNLEQTTRKFNW